MNNVTRLTQPAANDINATRAQYLYGLLKAERWTLRPLEGRTGIAKSTLAAKFNGSSPLLFADIEVFAEVLKRDAAGLAKELLEVGPAGIEPTTSTVESQQFNDHMAPVISLDEHRVTAVANLTTAAATRA